MLKLFNCSIQDQVKGIPEFLKKNEKVWSVIENAHELRLPNWYVGAGCLVQTIWNIQTGLPPDFSIKDIDLVYFDASDLSKEAELFREERARKLFAGLGIEIDVKNQARVHLWYEGKFGYSILPYSSSEAAINTWPTTATAIAVRKELGNPLDVYAPFGLNDVYGMVARANKTQITEEIFLAKVSRWKRCWPNLKVIPWAQA